MFAIAVAVVAAACLPSQVEVTLHQMPTAAATSGSQLMLTAGREKYPELAAIEFDPPQAVVLANQEIVYGVMAVPTTAAADTIDAALAGRPQPVRGAPVALVAYFNLLPEEIDDQTECYHFPWKNDTVRKLAAVLVTAQPGGPGELRLQFWGPAQRPLFEVIVPAVARQSQRFLEFDYVKNDLEFKLFGSLVFSQRLRACLFNY